jgi:3-hydroxyisobutyrate dehydrogenase-like beta-hydroxyacid dehydrogenase
MSEERRKLSGGNDVPDGAARRHDPQPAFDLATERAALDEQHLPLLVAVRIELESADVGHLSTERDDRARHVIRIDPFELLQFRIVNHTFYRRPLDRNAWLGEIERTKAMRIGVIGLGAMGKQIARQLLGAGHELTVWNRNANAADELVAAGAKRAGLVSEALQGDITISVLFDDDAVRSVLLAKDGLPIANRDGVHVCMTTVTVAFGRELDEFHACQHLSYVAAPMLGRPDIIIKGGLNVLAGADPLLLDRIEAPLASLGKLWRLGSDPVQAQVAKLAANFMISGALESMAEAIAVLRSYGADADKFLGIMSETLFSSFIYKSYGPMIAGLAPSVPSGLSLPLKDNRSFLEAADASGIKVPLADIVRQGLTRAAENGLGALDWSTALAKIAEGSVGIMTPITSLTA